MWKGVQGADTGSIIFNRCATHFRRGAPPPIEKIRNVSMRAASQALSGCGGWSGSSSGPAAVKSSRRRATPRWAFA